MHWNPHLGNILTVFASADRWDKDAGLNAYTTYNTLMVDLARQSGVSVQLAAAVFAALSPNADYKTNLESARRTLGAFKDGKEIDDFRVTTYGQNKRKAWSILNGVEPLDALKAKKTRSFYQNIADPNDPVPVTIDGHMFSVWNLKRYRMQDAQIGTGRLYDKIAKDFRLAAFAVGLLPNQLQAVCWFTWKRKEMIAIDAKALQLPLGLGMEL